MSFKQKAALIQLKIGMWGGERLDRKETRETERRANAAEGSVRTVKKLVPDGMLKPVRKAANKLRALYYDSTAPWVAEHSRVVQRAKLLPLLAELDDAKTAFASEVSKFEAAYREHVESGAAAERLGDMYVPQDFPEAADLAHRFTTSVLVTPIPDSEAWALGIPAEELDQLKERLDAELDKAEASVQAYWTELVGTRAEALAHALEHSTKLYRSLADKLVDITGGVAGGDYDLPADVEAEVKPLHQLALQVQSAFDSDKAALAKDSFDRAAWATSLKRRAKAWEFFLGTRA